MKKRKFIVYSIVFIVLFFLFRGFLFRAFVNYSKVDSRKNSELVNKDLIKEIDSLIGNKKLDIEEIIEISNTITSKNLNFTFDKCSSNPNLVYQEKKANCIGYASLFNATGDYIIRKQKLNSKYEFNHLVGKIDFLGFDIHKIFNLSFFKDHDFNEIRNKETGEIKFVDPSVSDCLKIDYVSSQ